MRYLLLLLLLLFLQTAFIQAAFTPGFLAPDLLLIALLSRAYLKGRDTVLWAILGGALLDLLTDTLGLGLALETLSTYLFILISERVLFKTGLAFLISGAGIALLKKLLALVLMSFKFSFDISVSGFISFWMIEVFLLLITYILYLKRRDE